MGEEGKKEAEAFVERVVALGFDEQAKMSSIYDDWAASYNTHMDALHFSAPDYISRFFALIPSSINVPPNELRVLDVGCGTGATKMP